MVLYSFLRIIFRMEDFDNGSVIGAFLHAKSSLQ
jgi:hypothetical protein